MEYAMEQSERDRVFWEEQTESYELFLRLFGGPFDRARELLRGTLDGGDEVLEVAAGTGELTAAIAPEVERLVATDYADAMVERLSERSAAAGYEHVECERADIYELPYASGTFDTVVAGNVLHLLPDFSSAVDELTRVLRAGGTLIAPTFVHDETWLGWATSRALSLAGGPENRHFDVDSFVGALEDEALEVRRQETISGMLPMAYVECRPEGGAS